MKHRLFGLFIVILISLLALSSVAAQGVATLTYGGSATGTLSAEAPLNLYAFAGNAGDLVTAEILGLEPGMTPTISLLGPNQQVLSGGTLDGFSATSRSASITRFLPAPGVYTLLVGGSAGQYLVLLNATPATTTTAPLALPASTSVSLNPDAEQVVTIANSSPNPVALAVSGGSSVAPFSVAVYNTDGQPLAVFSGAVGDVCVGIPGGTGNFMVILAGENAGQPLAVALSAAEGRCSSLSAAPQPTQQSVQPPAATPEVTGQNPSAACTVSSGSAVNVRSGPSTNYGIITTLAAGVQAPVIGQSDAGWVVIQINGVQGFVSQSVVGTFGNCGGLPFIPAPPLGQPPQPAQPTATTPPVQQQQPTATQEQQQQQPTATQEQQQQQPTQPPPTATTPPPPTATEAAQIAPPDSNYALNIQLDGSGAVSEVVSFPDGDTEDVVSYAVNGLNNSVALPGGQANLTFTFSCSGTGTQFVVFIVDGQTKTCGQTHLRVVNADSRTGAVRVRATGGTGTFVQWTVSAVAPRVN